MAKKDKDIVPDLSSIDQARRALLSNINKKFKADLVREFTITQKLPRVSTSYFLLDDILGGGIPEGRIIEIYGWESSGKSFLTTKIMSSAQAQDKGVFLFDVENSFNLEFATKCGLKVDGPRFGYSDEQNAAKIFEVIREICRINGEQVDLGNEPLYPVIVVDSVAALMTEHEEENEATHAKIGDLAMTLSRGLKKLPRLASHGKTTIIFINQIREKIGVMYGDPETTPGGNALKFFASLRLKLRRAGGSDGTIYGSGGKEDKIGHKVVATVVKNKTAPPHRKAEFTIFYDGRTDDTEDIFAMCDKYELWDIKGNIRTYTTADGVEIRKNGKAQMLEAIRAGGQHLRDELVDKIKNQLALAGASSLSAHEMQEIAKEAASEEDWSTDSEEEDDFSIEKDLDAF